MTLYHIFIECPLYSVQRKQLFESLKEISVTYTVRNLLGGGNHELNTQIKIMNFVAKYLYEINMLHVL